MVHGNWKNTEIIIALEDTHHTKKFIKELILNTYLGVKMNLEMIGRYSFIAGVIIAIVTGFLGAEYNNTVVLVLVVLGIIIGFLNITEKEIYNFLIAAIALLLTGAANLGVLPVVGQYLGPILTNISTLIAPAVVIVALKAVYTLGKEK